MTVAAFFGHAPKLEWKMIDTDAALHITSDSRHMLGTFEDMGIATHVVCQLHPDVPENHSFGMLPFVNGSPWEAGQLKMGPSNISDDRNLLLQNGSFWARLLLHLTTKPADMLQIAAAEDIPSVSESPKDIEEFWFTYYSSKLRVSNLFLTTDPKPKLALADKSPTYVHFAQVFKRLPMPNASFDSVCDHGILIQSSITQLEFYLAEYYRVLRPGGILYVKNQPDIPLTPHHNSLETHRVQAMLEPLRNTYLNGILQDDLQVISNTTLQPHTILMSDTYRDIILRRHRFEILSSGDHLWGMNSSFLCRKV